MAFVVAYFYYEIHSKGVPIVPALILSAFVFAPLLGLALDRLCLRRLAKAPVYARIVGTIGLLIALPAAAQWLVVEVANGVFGLKLIGNAAITQGVPTPGIGPTPPHYFRFLRGVALNTDQLAVFVVAACAAILLWYLLRRTRMGLEMRAVVDRDVLASLRGINANRTSAAAWMLSMVLAGLGGVLIAPLFILDPTIFEFVVLGSLAAVVFGGLRSLPMTFAGGLLIGVVQNLVAGYSTVLPNAIANLSGLQDSIPYLLVLVLGPVLGRASPAGRICFRRTTTVRSPRRNVGASSKNSLGLVCGVGRWLRIALVSCVVDAGRYNGPNGNRGEHRDGHHLSVIRRGNRTGRHGEPGPGDIRHCCRIRSGMGAKQELGHQRSAHCVARGDQFCLGRGRRWRDRRRTWRFGRLACHTTRSGLSGDLDTCRRILYWLYPFRVERHWPGWRRLGHSQASTSNSREAVGSTISSLDKWARSNFLPTSQIRIILFFGVLSSVAVLIHNLNRSATGAPCSPSEARRLPLGPRASDRSGQRSLSSPLLRGSPEWAASC